MLAMNEDDLVPHDPALLRTFRFDRCTDWHMLFGLYQGITQVMEAHAPSNYKAQLRQAVAEQRPLHCIERIYETFLREQHMPPSDHYSWFLKHKAQLLEADAADSAAPSAGCKVRIKGLQATPALNGALGKVSGPADPHTGRFPVRLHNPHTAVAKFRAGVNVKPANMEVVPAGAAAAVLIIGFAAHPAYVFGTPVSEGWRQCPVPHLLGLPLAYMRPVSTWIPRESDDRLGTYLLIDPVSGMAPLEVQRGGVSPMLVARTDGRDFSVSDLWDLHDYNCHLLDLWGSGRFTPARRQQALTRAAYTRHVEQHGCNPFRDPEEEDEEEGEWEGQEAHTGMGPQQ